MPYQIADEPHETSLAAYVVRPGMPLLAAMMCGAWLSWPWFAFNAIAMGSPTKKKELGLCAAAAGGTLLLAAVLIALVRGRWIESTLVIRLSLLAIVGFKLSFSYYIAAVQRRTFHVYEYYGGAVRAAGRVLLAGFLLRGMVIGMIDDPHWWIVVSGLV